MLVEGERGERVFIKAREGRREGRKKNIERKED